MREDDALPLSGVQHVTYCERQAALIHVERVWLEDAATASGHVLHERADIPGADHRRGVRIERAVGLYSARLGLRGVADTVELAPDAGIPGGLRPVPVEYKRGRVKDLGADRIQLCAQAICLEEMLGVHVPSGTLYYAGSHRRVDVAFDGELRDATARAASRFHALVDSGTLPVAAEGPKCRRCSLLSVCLPIGPNASRRVARHLKHLVEGGEP